MQQQLVLQKHENLQKVQRQQVNACFVTLCTELMIQVNHSIVLCDSTDASVRACTTNLNYCTDIPLFAAISFLNDPTNDKSATAVKLISYRKNGT